MSECLSIDHLILEKFRDEDGDHMSIIRFGREGERIPAVSFRIGDGPAALGFLSQMAELFGVQITVPEEK